MGLPRRAIARLLDGLILSALIMLAAAAYPFWPISGSAPFIVLVIVVVVLYEWGSTTRWGATPGKQLAGIVVTHRSGSALSARTSALRMAAGTTLIFLWPLGAIALVIAIMRPRTTPLHDKITRTTVRLVPRHQPTHAADILAGLPIGVAIVSSVVMAVAAISAIPFAYAGAVWWLWPIVPGTIAQALTLGGLIWSGRRRPSLAFGAFTAVTIMSLGALLRATFY